MMQKKNDTTGSLNNADARTHTQPLGACVSDVGNLKEQNDEASAGADVQLTGLGAPPSNTAPHNYINAEKTKILRYGIDSLYLSFPGTLSQKRDDELRTLKLSAQSPDEAEKANAQIKIGGHLFEVSGRGGNRFSFVIKNNFFHIQLSNHDSTSMPLAYVQISSELLTFSSIENIVKDISFVINSCGFVTGQPRVSRVDIFADFTTSWPTPHLRDLDWVTRAHDTAEYNRQSRFSGWAIGQGSAVSARLYDKTLELKKSKKEYLKPLWQEGGWNGQDYVWRLEFQLKREALSELKVLTVDDLLSHLLGLWRYCSCDWLKLTIPNPNDSNQSRWDIHPLWSDLQKVMFSTQSGAPLKRVRKERIPSDESIFIGGLGGFTSFMAKNKIFDINEGFSQFRVQAEHFHRSKGKASGTGLKEYVETKVKAKGRKYNTLDNRRKLLIPKGLANPYRQAKNGE